MAKRAFLIFVSVLMLFIVGCTSGQTVDLSGNPFVGGSNGLIVEFITGSPPDEVFDNEQFPFTVSVKLENSGERDIEEGEGFLRITGVNPAEFGISESDLREDIPEIRSVKKASDQSIIQGGTEVVTFSEMNYQKDEPGNFEIDSFRVQACYDYGTIASTTICVKEENVDGLKDNEICLVNEDKPSLNSGAPIHIQNVKETSKGKDGIQISFDLVHVGNPGDTWFPVGDNECNDQITNTDLYKVEVEVDPIIDGRYGASCSGGDFNGGNKGTVRMFDGQPRKVICSFDIGDQASDFETRVNINLDYRYQQFIEKRLLIKDLGITE